MIALITLGRRSSGATRANAVSMQTTDDAVISSAKSMV